MFKPEPISRAGYNMLKAELTRLEKDELPEVVRTVAEARAEGDLKENAAYIYGRQRQGHMVGRINELKGLLSSADIIDCTKVNCDCADFGTVVTLLNLDTEEKVTYQLLGTAEADIDTGSVSIQSPIGGAIIGHCVGDKFTATVPRGDLHFEVVAISAPEVD
jgi:transcription elongation factor GreA